MTSSRETLQVFDCELATVGHRVARVDDEIHHDLFELRAVRADMAKIVREDGSHLHVFANQAAEHFSRFCTTVLRLNTLVGEPGGG